MDDIERLIDFINNYFPDPSYSRDDVKDYLEKKVKGWEYVPKKAQQNILDDWEMAIQEQIGEVELREVPEIKRKGGHTWERIKRFLGRLFGR